MKCDLLKENELNKKVKDGKNLASLINAHHYLVSNTTRFNVDTDFNDILVQAYNTYHFNSNDCIPTENYYKETIDNSIYSSILSNKEKKENDTYSSQMKETLKLNYSKIFRCIKCWKIAKLQINELNNP